MYLPVGITPSSTDYLPYIEQVVSPFGQYIPTGGKNVWGTIAISPTGGGTFDITGLGGESMTTPIEVKGTVTNTGAGTETTAYGTQPSYAGAGEYTFLSPSGGNELTTYISNPQFYSSTLSNLENAGEYGGVITPKQANPVTYYNQNGSGYYYVESGGAGTITGNDIITPYGEATIAQSSGGLTGFSIASPTGIKITGSFPTEYLPAGGAAAANANDYANYIDQVVSPFSQYIPSGGVSDTGTIAINPTGGGTFDITGLGGLTSTTPIEVKGTVSKTASGYTGSETTTYGTQPSYAGAGEYTFLSPNGGNELTTYISNPQFFSSTVSNLEQNGQLSGIVNPQTNPVNYYNQNGNGYYYVESAGGTGSVQKITSQSQFQNAALSSTGVEYLGTSPDPNLVSALQSGQLSPSNPYYLTTNVGTTSSPNLVGGTTTITPAVGIAAANLAADQGNLIYQGKGFELPSGLFLTLAQEGITPTTSVGYEQYLSSLPESTQQEISTPSSKTGYAEPFAFYGFSPAGGLFSYQGAYGFPASTSVNNSVQVSTSQNARSSVTTPTSQLPTANLKVRGQLAFGTVVQPQPSIISNISASNGFSSGAVLSPSTDILAPNGTNGGYIPTYAEKINALEVERQQQITSFVGETGGFFNDIGTQVEQSYANAINTATKENKQLVQQGTPGTLQYYQSTGQTGAAALLEYGTPLAAGANYLGAVIGQTPIVSTSVPLAQFIEAGQTPTIQGAEQAYQKEYNNAKQAGYPYAGLSAEESLGTYIAESSVGRAGLASAAALGYGYVTGLGATAGAGTAGVSTTEAAAELAAKNIGVTVGTSAGLFTAFGAVQPLLTGQPYTTKEAAQAATSGASFGLNYGLAMSGLFQVAEPAITTLAQPLGLTQPTATAYEGLTEFPTQQLTSGGRLLSNVAFNAAGGGLFTLGKGGSTQQIEQNAAVAGVIPLAFAGVGAVTNVFVPNTDITKINPNTVVRADIVNPESTGTVIESLNPTSETNNFLNPAEAMAYEQALGGIGTVGTSSTTPAQVPYINVAAITEYPSAREMAGLEPQATSSSVIYATKPTTTEYDLLASNQNVELTNYNPMYSLLRGGSGFNIQYPASTVGNLYGVSETDEHR